MNRHLVVSRYNENVDWIKEVDSSTKVFLYNKGTPPKAEHIQLPNVGRESHTYLYHIIKHYEKLPDITIFVQGNPFDHTPNLQKILTLEDVDQIWEEMLHIDPQRSDRFPGYLGISHYWAFDITASKHRNDCRVPPIKDTWPKLFDDPLPKLLWGNWGAQFVLSRWRIMSRPLRLYNFLYDCHFSHWHMPWAMESLWIPLFFKPLGVRKPRMALLL